MFSFPSILAVKPAKSAKSSKLGGTALELSIILDRTEDDYLLTVPEASTPIVMSAVDLELIST